MCKAKESVGEEAEWYKLLEDLSCEPKPPSDQILSSADQSATKCLPNSA